MGDYLNNPIPIVIGPKSWTLPLFNHILDIFLHIFGVSTSVRPSVSNGLLLILDVHYQLESVATLFSLLISRYVYSKNADF